MADKHKLYDEHQALEIIMGMDEQSESDDSVSEFSSSSEESLSEEDTDEQNDDVGRKVNESRPEKQDKKRCGPRTRGGHTRRGVRTRGGRGAVQVNKYLNVEQLLTNSGEDDIHFLNHRAEEELLQGKDTVMKPPSPSPSVTLDNTMINEISDSVHQTEEMVAPLSVQMAASDSVEVASVVQPTEETITSNSVQSAATSVDVREIRMGKKKVQKGKKSTVIWDRKLPEVPIFEFKEEEKLHVEVPPDADPSYFFNLLCNQQLFEDMVHYTNLYAKAVINKSRKSRRSRLNNWHDVDVAEMKKFVGLLLMMGLVRLPSYQLYWSSDNMYRNSFAKDVMPRDRFLLIMRFWHFGDLDEFPGDRLGKIRYMINHVNDLNNTLYTPGKNLSLDESMMLWRGRLVFRQYVKGKRHKYGIKFYELCTADGFVLKIKIYSGKDADEGDHDIGKTATVVTDLMEDYLDKGYHLFMDNYYNSFMLTKFLSGRSTYVTGTLRVNRGDNPKNIMEKKLSKGEMVWAQSDNIVALKWKDKRDVQAISNAHVPKMVTTTNRHGKENMKPNVIRDYNENMSGIDRSDQMMAYHSGTRKTVRWYKKVGVHILEMLLTNTHYLYRKYSSNPMKYASIMKFKTAIVRQLVGPPRQKTIPRGQFHYLRPIPPTEKKQNPTRQCKQCSNKAGNPRKETRYMCALCVDDEGKNIPLCIDPCNRIHHQRMLAQDADSSMDTTLGTESDDE